MLFLKEITKKDNLFKTEQGMESYHPRPKVKKFQ